MKWDIPGCQWKTSSQIDFFSDAPRFCKLSFYPRGDILYFVNRHSGIWSQGRFGDYVCQNIEKIFLPALQCVLSAAESNCSVFSQLLSQINLILRVWQISLFTCVSRSGNEGTEMSKSAILVSNFMGALQNFRA